MVKYSILQTTSSSRRIKIPIKIIIFWYKKIKSYINTQNINLINSKECPTIYISKKYPRMSILELYQRINNHLLKYYPKVYQKLNSNTKRCLIKLKKHTVKLKEKENIEKTDKTVIIQNSVESKKTPCILISLGKKNKHSEKIKSLNEKNCQNIKHLFRQHKFEDDIYEKYNNCYVKEIVIDDDNNNNNNNDNDDNDNDKDDNESFSSSMIDDVSPYESTSYSSSNGYNNNRINYLTHFRNIPRKSKYFNNDDYYSNKLKSIGDFNNNK